ncbi:sodium/potassium-transporting ATPase subunit alpha-like [Cylas formicarius]|uniref:sodium/potassium-transporting ATPase subunit alpha-like n=1 Tax=Cylas formicarius TaxID=197179 RepID=UPI00295863F4|nr:sodium/potassium-transporting ATPase subunit alpha-like [Cylas formicarius]
MSKSSPSLATLRSRGRVTSVVSLSSTGVHYLRPVKKVRTEKDLEEFKKDVFIDDHTLTFDELESRYETDLENGLTKWRADELLIQNGPNCLVPSETTSKWAVLAKFLFGGFNTLIWTGSMLSYVEYIVTALYDESHAGPESLWLASILAGIATITGLVGFYMEQTHSAIIESFKKMIPKYAKVIREGSKYSLPSEELVLGDVVEIVSGDMVPADMRILESRNLKVDNSPLTGESMAQSRGSEYTHEDPMETKNLVFYGTCVVEGRGRGVVIRCGDDTVLGHIAGLATAIVKDETLLRKELNAFVKVISVIACLIGTALFAMSMAKGYTFFQSFTYFIAIVVAQVPEGLPVAFTVCLTLTAKRMARKNCLIKKFEILETLGACDVICSDKTGTLTQNKMTASRVFYDASEVDVLNYWDDVDVDSVAYRALCDVAVLCSRADFDDARNVIGDPSESAILMLMDKLVDIETTRKRFPKVIEIPFSSSNKYQVSVHRVPTGGFLVVMKGAPEKVLDHCASILRDGEALKVNSRTAKPIARALANMGRKGERVLGFADLYLPDYDYDYKFDVEHPDFPLTGLRFVGLLSLIDPPRPSVVEAVSKCRSAGIKVIMVTGDHPITAAAIARKVGIISPHLQPSVENITLMTSQSHSSSIVVTGSELKQMEPSRLEQVLKDHDEIVFARTTPQQKLGIVEALQRLNRVVAATGDGVNDSPALKKADIGIAMGISGSDVSKEAADMILLDDNFASIVRGIEEGRLIFDNLKKSIAYELTANVPEIAPFIFLILLNIPQPLSIIAILLIDVGTDLWGAISLAYEKPEADIMNRNPRDPGKDKLINRRLIVTSYFQIGMIQVCSAFACYFYTMAQYGFFWDRLIGIRKEWEDRTVNDLVDSYGQEWSHSMRMILTRKGIASYFMSIVITQIGDLLRCKTRRLSLFQQGMTNHVLNTGLTFQIMLGLLFVYCPGLNRVFDFDAIPVASFAPALPFCLFIVVYDEFRKFMIRSFPRGFFHKETYY